MKIKELLHKKGCDVVTVGVDTTVYDAIDLMSQKDIGALVVMCRGELCGIISERDYRNKIILMGRKSKETPVSQIMTHEVFCIHPDYTVQECMSIMSRKKIRHLPVLDEEKKLTGIISIGDIVKAIIDEQKNEIQNLRDFISSGYPG